MSEFKVYADTIHGWHADEIQVFAFHGIEEMSLAYQYEIGVLVRKDFSPTDAIGREATFVFKEGGKEGEDLVIHGKFAAIETIGHFEDEVAYRFILVPRVWNMSLALHSRVWTGKTIPEIFRWIFDHWGITEAKKHGESHIHDQFLLDLAHEPIYPTRDIVCQYNETDLAFISRWMEREGMYFYFDQHVASHPTAGPVSGGSCMVITDQRPDTKRTEPHYPLNYGDPKGHVRGKIESLHGRMRAISYNFAASDYDYTNPNVPKAGSKRVDQADQKASQLDTVVLYGEHFCEGEAQRIATVRADILTTERHVSHGEGATRGLKVGRVFELHSTHHQHLPGETHYLVTRLEHWGSVGKDNPRAQKAFDNAQVRSLGALAIPDSLDAKREPYRVRFTCVPISTGKDAPYYRHAQSTPIPKINSVTRATVNAGPNPGIPLYAITLDFDELGTADVPARLAQPQGQMQFELEPGTEVLVEFLAGNLDRPFIASAVPNTLKFGPKPALGSNLIQSRGRINSVELNEIEGQQSITSSTQIANTFLQMGQIQEQNGSWTGAKLKTDGATQFNFGQTWDVQTQAAVTHSFVDSYQLTLKAPQSSYSYKVEDSGTPQGQVTESAGQITRNTAGDHSLNVGADYLLSVKGVSSVAANSYGLNVPGSNMTVDVNGYRYQPNHVVTVEQDQIESVLRNHSLSVTQDHTITVGGQHQMNASGDYTTTIIGQHKVVVKTGHSMSVQGPHEVVAGTSSHSTANAHTINAKTFVLSTSDAHTVLVQGLSTLTVNDKHNVTVASDHNLVVLGAHEKRVTGNYDVVCGKYSLVSESVNITSNLTIIH